MPKADAQQMSDEEIRGVFETLQLPPEPPPVPAVVVQPNAPIVFYTIGGNSPPLNTQ